VFAAAPMEEPTTRQPQASEQPSFAVWTAPPALTPFDDALRDARRSAPAHGPPPVLRRDVVGVIGLVPGAGASTCAALLAAELGSRDPGGAALLVGERPWLRGGLSRSARELAARLAPLGLNPAGGAGRVVELTDIGEGESLEILRMLAPCVLGPAAPGTAESLAADRTVIVAGRGVEPALAGVAAASLASAGAYPVLAVNRATEPGAWDGRAAALLPERRLAVRSAGLGRPAPGALGAAVRELADRLGEDPAE
jgi:hypothetical protein